MKNLHQPKQLPRLVTRMTTVAAVLVLSACAQAPSGGSGGAGSGMSFFVTSSNPGKGADFGGLSGADQYCQQLAATVGAGGRTWHAYLSNSTMGGAPAVNARDRIGRGPWKNARGEVIANNVDELHASNNINKQTALTEKDRKSTRLNSSHIQKSRMPSSA